MIGCKMCQKSNESLFEIKFNCNHTQQFCLDCMDKIDQNKCSDCHQEHCSFCKQTVNKENRQMLFKNCKDQNNHKLIQCNDCRIKRMIKLTSQEEKYCFICFIDLKKFNLLYYREDLNCEGKHKINLCGKCKEVFTNNIKRCYECIPVKNQESVCVACHQEIDFPIEIKPILCDEQSHTMNICMDCIEHLSDPILVCRFCQVKEKQYIYFNKFLGEEYQQIELIGGVVASNQIDMNFLDVDLANCPQCKSHSLYLDRVSEMYSQQQSNKSFELSAIAKIGDNQLLLAGGYENKMSSKVVSLLSFYRDGRSKYFVKTEFPLLNVARHGAGIHLDSQKNIIYVIGGIQIGPNNEIKYQFTIESLKIDHTNIPMDQWKLNIFRLSQRRACFSSYFLNEELYIFGGFNGIKQKCNSVEILNFNKKTSETIETDYEIPIYCQIIQIENNLILKGGFGDQLEFNIEHKQFIKKENRNNNYRAQFIQEGNLTIIPHLQTNKHYLSLNDKQGKYIDEKEVSKELQISYYDEMFQIEYKQV